MKTVVNDRMLKQRFATDSVLNHYGSSTPLVALSEQFALHVGSLNTLKQLADDTTANRLKITIKRVEITPATYDITCCCVLADVILSRTHRYETISTSSSRQVLHNDIAMKEPYSPFANTELAIHRLPVKAQAHENLLSRRN